jgi:hypothetical protein
MIEQRRREANEERMNDRELKKEREKGERKI